MSGPTVKFENPVEPFDEPHTGTDDQGSLQNADYSLAAGRTFVKARFSDLSKSGKLFTTYQTPRVCVIQDAGLAVTFRCMQFLVMIYVSES